MKLYIDRQIFKENLALVYRAIPKNPMPALLGYLKLTAFDRTLKICGSDGKLTVETEMEVKVERGGEILVCSTLVALISKIEDEEIVLSLAGKRLIIENSTGTIELATLNAKDYPIKQLHNQKQFTLPTEIVNAGVKSTIFCASKELSKGILTGIKITAKSDEKERTYIEFASTDSNRLSVYRNTTSLVPEFATIVPAVALQKLLLKLAAIDDPQTAITIAIDETHVEFIVDNYRLNTPQMLGDYPDYNKLFADTYSLQIIAERQEVIRQLEIAEATSDRRNCIQLNFERDCLTISSRNDLGLCDLGVAVKSMGAMNDSNQISFNLKYLLQSLKNIETTEVKFEFETPAKPVSIQSLGKVTIEHLLMPVIVKS